MATYPWDQRRDITSRELIDELRMPRVYGDTWGDPAGMVDPAALTALSQGGAYDIQARRDAIAKRLLDNELAQRAQQVAAVAPTASAASVSDVSRGYFPDGDVSQGVGGAQAGDSMGGNTSTASTGWGGSAVPGSDFMGGAPPGNSMFGTGDRSFNEPGGAMVTSQAAMVGEPGWDPASESPTFTEPDPAVSPVSGYGRTGDDSSQQSQDKQAADRAALAEAALAAIAANAPAAPTATPALADPDAEPDAEPGALAEGMGGKGDKGFVSGTYAPNFDRTFAEADKASPTYGGMILGPVTGIPGVPGIPSFQPGDVPPDPGAPPSGRSAVATNTPQPGGRAPMSFATPNEGDTIASPGGAPGGFGGFSEGTPGGYAGGSGMTTGFGAGYSGSSDFGNTQGGQGFTTGATPDPGSGGFTGGGGGGTAGDTAGTGDTSGGGGSSSGGDTAGGSPGGVG